MTNKSSAVIIGAGIGGIATAARLARQGFSVTVLEKSGHPGGRCSQISRDGHRFDVGPTIFLMPEVWRETFATLGENMDDYLKLRRIDPTYKVHFADGLRIELTTNMGQMQSQLEKVEKDAFQGFLRYMAEGSKHYNLALQKFVVRNFYHALEYFSLANIPLLFKLKALITHYANTGLYFKDERLRALFSFQNMYLGLSPYNAPATYSLLQYTELAEGIWFPEGGMYQGITALTSVAEKLGVRFLYDTPVKAIHVQGNRVQKVETQDGQFFSADVFVGNADLPYIYKELLPSNVESSRLEKKKYTSSAILFYWGVDKTYPHFNVHNFFLGKDYKASFDQIFRDHDLPEDPSFYIHAPSRVDVNAAPQGQDTLYVLVPVGHIDDNHPKTDENWNTLVQRARETIFSRLEKETGISDLREHIKFEIVHTPVTWKEKFNLLKGSIFGLSHNFLQVGYLRPKNRHATFRNLYFTGASTHPGTGLPIVLLSARLTTERIIKEMKNWQNGAEKITAKFQLSDSI